MQHLRCKCGKKTIMTSMGTKDCEGCEECKTTFSFHPDYHEELKPHTWETKYNQNTGKPYKVCSKCSYIDKQSYLDSKIK